MDLQHELDPSRCSLVIIDMQNDFCAAQGAAARLGQDTSLVRRIVPNIKRLVQAARDVGVAPIFFRVVHNKHFDTPAWMARGRSGTTLNIDEVPIVEEDSWGVEFYELAPEEDDLVITKYRYSAFAFTPLELALRHHDSDTVILCGTQTNVCVEATANDALFKGFFPVVVSDCVATGSLDLHEAALRDFAERTGRVVTLGEVLKAWKI